MYEEIGLSLYYDLLCLWLWVGGLDDCGESEVNVKRSELNVSVDG